MGTHFTGVPDCFVVADAPWHKDSAPGPDGIPYSAWSLSPEGSYPVLDQLMMKMLAGLRAAPVQVGVWIPKAKVGPSADYFRPLGMPNTCDRLVDGTIAAVS